MIPLHQHMVEAGGEAGWCQGEQRGLARVQWQTNNLNTCAPLSVSNAIKPVNSWYGLTNQCIVIPSTTLFGRQSLGGQSSRRLAAKKTNKPGDRLWLGAARPPSTPASRRRWRLPGWSGTRWEGRRSSLWGWAPAGRRPTAEFHSWYIIMIYVQYRMLRISVRSVSFGQPDGAC